MTQYPNEGKKGNKQEVIFLSIDQTLVSSLLCSSGNNPRPLSLLKQLGKQNRKFSFCFKNFSVIYISNLSLLCKIKFFPALEHQCRIHLIKNQDQGLGAKIITNEQVTSYIQQSSVRRELFSKFLQFPMLGSVSGRFSSSLKYR